MATARKLKIMLVDHAPVYGGAEVMVNDLIGALDKEKFSAVVATDESSRVSFRGEVRRLPMPRLRGNWTRIITGGLRLAAAAQDVDVMMTMTARTHAIGAVAAALARRPLIWRLADDTLPLALARALAGIPKQIIAVSKFVAGRCSPRPDKTAIIFDGLPDHGPVAPAARQRARRALGLKDGEVAAVMIARLVRSKGHAIFAKALAMTKDFGVKGFAAGGEDDSPGPLGGRGLRQELESLGAAITFLGHRTDVAEILAAGDIFVNASIQPEGFGRAVMEAMMAGVPVVASRIGGVPEIVGEAGRLYPAGDAAALAAALQMNEAARVRLGREGRARARQLFDLNAVARQFERAWREAAGF